MTLTNLSMSNIPFWNYLPMGMTNYGGRIQVFSLPDYYSNQVGCIFNNYAMYNMMNPIGMPMMQMPSISPDVIGRQIDDAIENAYTSSAEGKINCALRNIMGTRDRLNSMLETENISDESKQKIEELLAELDALEEKLNELDESEEEPKDKYKKAVELEKELAKLVKKVAKLHVKKSRPPRDEGEEDGGDGGEGGGE